MVELAPLSVVDASAQLDAIFASAGTRSGGEDLAMLYQVLLGATADTDLPPLALLATAIGIASAADEATVESLPPRVRVLTRLLRAGAAEAAWLVSIDSATGLVPRVFRASTSSGAQRTEWVLPLLTCIEPPNVYADLPGFHDPRYNVPDAAYEIGTAIRLRCHVDEVCSGNRPLLVGWAALDFLQTEPDEAVAVVAEREGAEIRWPGTRHRRADLVGGSRDSLRRRAWAGWSVEMLLSELPADGGRWALSLELVHAGLTRQVRLGRSYGVLAAGSVGAMLGDRPAIELADGGGGWSLQRLK